MSGLLYVGIFASIVAFLSWNKAIELAGPQRCAGFLNFIPLFSAIFATTFTGSHYSCIILSGAFWIVLGVYMTNLAMKKLASLTSMKDADKGGSRECARVSPPQPPETGVSEAEEVQALSQPPETGVSSSEKIQPLSDPPETGV